MTIVDAIKTVLSDTAEGLTAREIYDEIVKNNLYVFGAKNPLGVVNAQIRRRCVGLDFPTAYPIKIFRISGQQGKKNKFALYNENSPLEEKNKIRVKSKVSAEYLPEEKIGAAFSDHLTSIKQQVLDFILNNTSNFFEHLVVELLLKMGYGYDTQSGFVTGRSHDGGVDGIICEDKLGLDLIYIQAKKYCSTNKVGSKEIQAFIGAMQHIQKGVFITTSNYTRDAQNYIETQQQKNVKLINGDLLSELLVKYEVGVTVAQTISIYKIDTEYFNSYIELGN